MYTSYDIKKCLLMSNCFDNPNSIWPHMKNEPLLNGMVFYIDQHIIKPFVVSDFYSLWHILDSCQNINILIMHWVMRDLLCYGHTVRLNQSSEKVLWLCIKSWWLYIEFYAEFKNDFKKGGRHKSCKHDFFPKSP